MGWRRRGVRLASRQWHDAQRRIATAVGAVTLGLVALAFAAISDRAQHLFTALVARWPNAPLLTTPLIFAGVVALTRRTVPEARGSGIPQVIAASRSPEAAALGPLVSLRTAAAKLALTVAMLLGGGSVGREGPTVQISAAIRVWGHLLLRVPSSAGVLLA